jgi:putative FmdB family regulatory protein
MPLYEYHCGQCDLTFESLIRSASDQPSCPECRSIEVDKLLSVPATAQTAGGSAGMLPLSGGNGAAPSFGCGRPQCGSGRCAGLD